MTQDTYKEITKYLGGLIKGTEWEGHVYAVGGCVRDEIMGSEIKDIDLCVSLPSGGIRFAQWLRENGHTLKGVAVYPNYGTAMLHLKAFPDVELEFVQTRKEKYIDHSCRNPVTAFGTIEDDCMRRDLTINALYSNVSTGEIVDITGRGVDDIKNHVIRTPNDPDVIYDDDPLRILRCIRFASRYGWEIEQDTMDGMVRNVHRLDIISKERVKDELDKMLTCQHPVMAMELLRTTGAMHYVIPELEQTYNMEQNEYHFGTVWEHTLAVIKHLKSDRLELRMAALLHDIGKIRKRTMEDGKVHFLEHELASSDMVDEILRALKYSNEFIDEVAFLVRYHMICKRWGDECEHFKIKRLRKLQYLCDTEERFDDLMLIIDADNNSHSADRCMPRQVEIIKQRTEEMKAEGSAMFGYKLPLTGKDVMEIKGLQPGPQVKECLDYLMKLAFVNPLRDKDEFIVHLKGYRLKK
ncbi:MAG: HD domain-containing protein [Muribaculaceae bacterium]|nr:HD domain-containing protein [Muribaculaceae bacterium]